MNVEAITIRRMTASEIPAVTEMERAIFSDPWPVSAFRDALTDAKAFNLVAVSSKDAALVGYLSAQIVADEVQIHNVAVGQPFRRRGIGRLLLEHAECEGKNYGVSCCILEVRANNSPALAMYNRLGYRRIGRRRGYYRRPVCDALVLLKILDEAPSESLIQSGSTDGVVS